MKNFVTILLTGIALTSFSFTQAQKTDTVSFVHITDTHVSNLAGFHPEIVKRRNHYGDGAQNLVDFLSLMPKKLNAGFVTITGDMIDFYEGETADGKMKSGQVENFTRLLDNSDVPVYLTLGNHDVKSNYDASNPAYKSKAYYASDEQARATWIRSAPSLKNGTYYSRVVKVGATVYRLIFLDNSYYKPENERKNGVPFIMDLRQLYWLENQLKQSDSDVEILFMHMPLPWGDTKEKLTKLPEAVTNQLDLYDLLQQHPSVRLMLTGHEHESFLKDFRTTAGKNVTQVMTGAFGRDIGNWRKICLTAKSIIVSTPGSMKIEKVIAVE